MPLRLFARGIRLVADGPGVLLHRPPCRKTDRAKALFKRLKLLKQHQCEHGSLLRGHDYPDLCLRVAVLRDFSETNPEVHSRERKLSAIGIRETWWKGNLDCPLLQFTGRHDWLFSQCLVAFHIWLLRYTPNLATCGCVYPNACGFGFNTCGKRCASLKGNHWLCAGTHGRVRHDDPLRFLLPNECGVY